MDNFRGEMEAYTWADIEHGRQLLDEAAALATDDKVRQRISFLNRRYAFTCAAVWAHTISMRAIRWRPTDDDEDAIAMSNAVADAWRSFAARWSVRDARRANIPRT